MQLTLLALTRVAFGWTEPLIDDLPDMYVYNEDAQTYLCDDVDILGIVEVDAHTVIKAPEDQDLVTYSKNTGLMQVVTRVDFTFERFYKGSAGNVSTDTDELRLWWPGGTTSTGQRYEILGIPPAPPVGSRWIIGLEDVDTANWVDQDNPDLMLGLFVSAPIESQISTSLTSYTWADTEDAYDEWCLADLSTVSTPELCWDGLDNDGDTNADCDDSDCATYTDCEEIGRCDDGVDNDGDGDTDCADSDCTGNPMCTEGSVYTCNDGVDNDGAGGTDCADTKCSSQQYCHSTETICWDGFDNDGDGDIDCADSDCSADPYCPEGSHPDWTEAQAECTDGIDNDGDGNTDAADTGCDEWLDEGNQYLCFDGIDNDGDGDTDCADSDCTGISGVAVSSFYSISGSNAVTCGTEAYVGGVANSCTDNWDNDGDGDVDHNDDTPSANSCASNASSLGLVELAPGLWFESACADGLDNDSDGTVDCDDPDCYNACNESVQCADGVDNDQDGLTDAADGDCIAYYSIESNACYDTADNDADGDADCDDSDCTAICAAEDTLAECTDGFDNDSDGNIDCADSQCAAFGDCPEDTLAECTDGIDNDHDSSTDCADPGCSGFTPCIEDGIGIGGVPANCFDGIDNDQDGLTDCADAGCSGVSDNYLSCLSEEDGFATPGNTVNNPCIDGIDNDADGLVDCADNDSPNGGRCDQWCFELTAAACTDGFDNDSDGDVDCADSACASLSVCKEDSANSANCGDGIDNDLDGLVDCADSGCAGVSTPAGDCVAAGSYEQGYSTGCADGFDNDGDGKIDCADDSHGWPGCHQLFECSREDLSHLCNDGIDNDGDGLVDCDDTNCAGLGGCP